MRAGTNQWFICVRERPRAALRLFCFAFAGAGASVYNRWSEYLPEAVEVNAVQLPGHETRIAEAPFTNLSPLIAALSEAMLDRLDRPFALFGHSMGALISFELARLLRRDFRILPEHLFLSGLRPVQFSDFDPPIHSLNTGDALRELQSRYGLPGSLLADSELQQIFLPVIQADFAVCETYTYRPDEPLDCPVSVFGGLEDRKVDYRKLGEWQMHTTKPLKLQLMAGDHSFLESAWPEISRLVSEDLCAHVPDSESDLNGLGGIR
jgi:medium-chain acyl-[acyl-carrier-protein] hydrolase